jgi:hypothetical protein
VARRASKPSATVAAPAVQVDSRTSSSKPNSSAAAAAAAAAPAGDDDGATAKKKKKKKVEVPTAKPVDAAAAAAALLATADPHLDKAPEVEVSEDDFNDPTLMVRARLLART